MTAHSTQKIGLLTATIVAMNAMIGAGIFAIPAALAQKGGPASIITFLFVAFACWCMAQSLSRVAQLFPEEGSFYTYAKQWGGHYTGIIAASSYLIGVIIAMSLLSHAAGQHLAHYTTAINQSSLGIITLIILTFLNMMGVSLSSVGQKIIIALTLIPLIGTTFLCFSNGSITNLTPFAPHGISSIFDQTRIVIFAFFGFESITSLFALIKNPEKNLPRAISYSLLIVATLYLLFVFSLIFAIPASIFSTHPGTISNALLETFPHYKWIIEGIHFSCLFAIIGTLHSMIWASGELFLALVKKMKNQKAKFLIKKNILNHSSSIGLIGLAILLSYRFLKSNVLWDLTALFIIFTFICATFILLKIDAEWKSKRNIITLIGIATAFLIFYFATQSLINFLLI